MDGLAPGSLSAAASPETTIDSELPVAASVAGHIDERIARRRQAEKPLPGARAPLRPCSEPAPPGSPELPPEALLDPREHFHQGGNADHPSNFECRQAH